MTQTGNQSAASASCIAARQRVMRICADATETELQQALSSLSVAPAITDLRPPEQGLVMLRGRIGGSGGAFNLGAAPVTRAVVALATGTTGFSYLLGRCPERARLAAVVDALAQNPDYAEHIESALVAPVEARRSAERARNSEVAAATRVVLLTMVRGED